MKLPKILSRIEKTDSCWIWRGALNGRYGAAGHKDGKVYYAHRAVYENLVGDIPKGLELDHLCKNPRCVNPEHLEPVTHTENMKRARKEYCKRGHHMSGDNLYWHTKRIGSRHCKACQRLRDKKSCSII